MIQDRTNILVLNPDAEGVIVTASCESDANSSSFHTSKLF